MSKFDKFCHQILRYGIFLAAFAPLVVFRNFFSPFNFGKAVVFRVLIELLIIPYIWLAMRYPEMRAFGVKCLVAKPNAKNAISFALILFTVSMAVSTFAGVNWHQSFWGYWERMGGLFSWLHYMVFIVILVSVLRKKEDWMGFMFLSVLAAFISTIFGFFQKLDISSVLGATERFRIFGTIGNPAAFAGYLIFNFFFAVFLLRELSGRLMRFFLFSALVLFGAGIFMTAVRGALLGFGAGLSVLAVYSALALKQRISLKASRRKIFAGAALVIILLSGVWQLWGGKSSDSPYFRRVTDFSFEQTTIRQRLLVWQIALNGFLDFSKFQISNSKFWFGWGPENFGSVFSTEYDPKLFATPDDVLFDRAHNIIFDLIITQGVIGLMFIIFLGVAVISAVRSLEFSRFQKNTFYALLIAYFVQNLFFFDLFSTFLMMSVFLGFLITANAKSKLRLDLNLDLADLNSGNRISIKELTAWLLITVSVVSAVYYFNVKPVFANFHATRSYAYFSKNDIAKGMDFASKALKNAEWSEYDVSRKLAEGIIGSSFSLNQTNNEFDDVLNKLTASLKKNVSRNSFDYSEYIYLNRFFKLMPDSSEETKKMLADGISKTNKAPFLYFELFDTFAGEAKWGNAHALMNKALISGFDFPETKFRLGIAGLKIGLNNKNKQTVNDGFQTIMKALKQGYRNYSGILYVGYTLQESRSFEMLQDFYSQVASFNPKFFVHLSLSYLWDGKKDLAKEYADKALALDYKIMGASGFKTLYEIYQVLGDNKKRSEALLKSAP